MPILESFASAKAYGLNGGAGFADPFQQFVVYYINGDSLVDRTGRHTISKSGSAGLSTSLTSPVVSNRLTTRTIYAGNSTSDTLSIAGNLNDFNWSSSDWTVDYWYYDPGSSTDRYAHILVADGQNSKGTFKGGSNPSRSYSQYFYSNSGLGIGNGVSFSAGAWHHISFQRTASGTGYLHIDGTLVETGAFPLPGGTPSYASHGAWSAESSPFYIDEFRVTRALRYGSSNFTPKTFATGDALEIDPFFSRVQILVQNGVSGNFGNGGLVDAGTATWSDTTQVLSGSIASTKIGDGNKYFFTPHQSVYNDMSQGWCLEFYSYITNLGDSGYMMSKWSNPWQWQVSRAGSGLGLSFRDNNVGDTIQTTNAVTLNSWEHWAFVIDPSPSTSWRVYKNGAQVSSGNHNGNLNLSNSTRVGFGYKEDSGTIWNGSAYIDRVRLTMKNRYTSNFTPPTGPLPIRGE